MIKPEDLEKLKANVVKFFGNGLIHEKIIAMHLVIGMADTRHSVSTEADTVMRRVQSGIDWNEKVKVGTTKTSRSSSDLRRRTGLLVLLAIFSTKLKIL